MFSELEPPLLYFSPNSTRYKVIGASVHTPKTKERRQDHWSLKSQLICFLAKLWKDGEPGYWLHGGRAVSVNRVLPEGVWTTRAAHPMANALSFPPGLDSFGCSFLGFGADCHWLCVSLTVFTEAVSGWTTYALWVAHKGSQDSNYKNQHYPLELPGQSSLSH